MCRLQSRHYRWHFSCISVGNKQSLCPLMWGGAQEKSGGHIKNFSAGASRRHCAPSLPNCFRRHCINQRYGCIIEDPEGRKTELLFQNKSSDARTSDLVRFCSTDKKFCTQITTRHFEGCNVFENTMAAVVILRKTTTPYIRSVEGMTINDYSAYGQLSVLYSD